MNTCSIRRDFVDSAASTATIQCVNHVSTCMFVHSYVFDAHVLPACQV